LIHFLNVARVVLCCFLLIEPQVTVENLSLKAAAAVRFRHLVVASPLWTVTGLCPVCVFLGSFATSSIYCCVAQGQSLGADGEVANEDGSLIVNVRDNLVNLPAKVSFFLIFHV
jgi:hypothetical protein